MQLGNAAMADLAPDQRFRNYPDHLSTLAQRRVSHYAHQADASTAKYYADTAFRQELAQVLGGLAIGGTRADRRSTKNTDSLEFGHGRTLPLITRITPIRIPGIRRHRRDRWSVL